jgi:hypothetical protein
VVDARKLWAGGVATAVVAALVSVVGLLIARGVFDTHVLIPKSSDRLVNSSTVWYALVALLVALLATGLLHALLLFAPSPRTFFGWIMALATLAAAVVPFTTGAAMEVKLATAFLNLAIGFAITTTLLSVSRAAASTAYPPGFQTT